MVKVTVPLILYTLISTSLLGAYAEGASYSGRIRDLLSNAKALEYRIWTSRGGEEYAVRIGYRVLGEETVSGEPAWKTAFYVENENSLQAYIWISKSSGRALKVQVEGSDLPPEYAEMVAEQLFAAWFGSIAAFEEQWSVEGITEYAETPYGRFLYLGAEQMSFGPARLLVHKWRWEGYATAPEEYRYRSEAWLAPLSTGVVLVKVLVERFDGSQRGGVELLSIELAAPQALPKVVVKATVDKTSVQPGEDVVFTIRCSNEGQAVGFYNLTATVDGKVEKSWLLVLKPGETQGITYKLSLAEKGVHSVRIGEESFTISVAAAQQQANFELSELSISPPAPRAGERATITARVRNTGTASGSYDIVLKVSGSVVGAKTVTLNPGESTTVTFYYTPLSPGTYMVEVNELSSLSLIHI